MTRFYELRDDVTIPGRWHVGEIHRADGREPRLRAGILMPEECLTAEVTHPGGRLDFFLTSFAVPVATTRLARAMSAVARSDVQRLPVLIDGDSSYEVLNVVRVLPCLNEERSEFIKWTERDHRADLAGQYRQVTRLRIHAALVPEDVNVFRVQGWLVAVIVSEVVKEAMEKVGCVGALFQPVIE